MTRWYINAAPRMVGWYWYVHDPQWEREPEVAYVRHFHYSDNLPLYAYFLGKSPPPVSCPIEYALNLGRFYGPIECPERGV